MDNPMGRFQPFPGLSRKKQAIAPAPAELSHVFTQPGPKAAVPEFAVTFGFLKIDCQKVGEQFQLDVKPTSQYSTA
jgi:hypothetical protein